MTGNSRRNLARRLALAAGLVAINAALVFTPKVATGAEQVPLMRCATCADKGGGEYQCCTLAECNPDAGQRCCYRQRDCS